MINLFIGLFNLYAVWTLKDEDSSIGIGLFFINLFLAGFMFGSFYIYLVG